MTPSSNTVVKSELASGDLRHRCKHFGHKLSVALAPEADRIRHPFCDAQLAARESEVAQRVTGQGSEALEWLKSVLSFHLERFEFRKTLVIGWG